jgi:hypothetical protein
MPTQPNPLKNMAHVSGESLNSLFRELSDWELQLKPFREEIMSVLGGPEL